MAAILTLLVVLSVSLVITRIATIALTHTGLSRQTARFQARSAFTGVGYTTSESEKLVNHPLRRRILLIMMLLGNVGIVTVISTFLLGFIRIDRQSDLWIRTGILAGGLLLLLLLATSRWVERRLSALILWILRRYTRLNVMDYASILHLGGDYSIHELYVEKDDWMADQTLYQLELKDEGVLVLGITRRGGSFIGTPSGDTKILPGDTLILYGRGDSIDRLDSRRKGVGGKLAHSEAVTQQKAVQREERARDAGDTGESGIEKDSSGQT